MVRKKENFTRHKYTSRDEWLKMRCKGIGGSDAGVILGLSTWKSPRQLWLEKLECNPIEEDNDDEVITYGRSAENAIRTLFTSKFVNKLKIKHTKELLVSKKNPYLFASLDGEIEVLQDFEFETYDKQFIHLSKGMRGILEIKTKFMPTKDEWKDSIPDLYYAQGVHYMNVTGYDFIIYVVELRYANGCASIRNFLFTKEHVEEDMKYLEFEEHVFWNKVIEKEEIPLQIKL